MHITPQSDADLFSRYEERFRSLRLRGRFGRTLIALGALLLVIAAIIFIQSPTLQFAPSVPAQQRGAAVGTRMKVLIGGWFEAGTGLLALGCFLLMTGTFKRNVQLLDLRASAILSLTQKERLEKESKIW